MVKNPESVQSGVRQPEELAAVNPHSQKLLAQAVLMREYFPVKNARWYEKALCADGTQVHPDLFSVKGEAATKKTVCSECPVRSDCLAASFQEELPYDMRGYRGGLPANRRKSMVKEAVAGNKETVENLGRLKVTSKVPRSQWMREPRALLLAEEAAAS
ncbi:MAG: WhiB family transcriptional regulator [Candidatus Saccharimonadales bacterium]